MDEMINEIAEELGEKLRQLYCMTQVMDSPNMRKDLIDSFAIYWGSRLIREHGKWRPGQSRSIWKERIGDLYDCMSRGVQNIEKGLRADTGFIAELEKEHEKAERAAKPLTPERIGKMKAEISRLRREEKRRYRDYERDR